MGWFGSLELAYKYAIIFCSLLIMTLVAGGIKVVYDGKQLQKHIDEEELEAAGTPEDVHDLEPRELDEGDLFGIRAIELGYFGGVAQSRPTSAAGSQSTSGSMSDTLMESPLSLKLHSTTPMSSAQSLPFVARQPSPLTLNTSESHDINLVTSPVQGKAAVINPIYARCYQPWRAAERSRS